MKKQSRSRSVVNPFPITTEPPTPAAPPSSYHEPETLKSKLRSGGTPLRSLASIRAQALEARADTAHIIAELEAWRHEIEATLAFLKAQR